MTQALRKVQPRKDYGLMPKEPDLLAAVMKIDLAGVRECVRVDPTCVNQVDEYKNNAVHLCIGGGTPRTAEIMQFLVSETTINLLHRDARGRTPFDLAVAMNDEQAAEILFEPTNQQLTVAYPPDEDPDLTPIR